MTGLFKRFSGENAEPSFPEPVRVSQHARETEPVCPRSGPPNSWFDEHGKYTPGCAACKNLELGLSRGGKVHSAKCCQDYVKWLKSEREKLVESPNLGPAGACGDVEVPVPRDVEESLSVDRNFDYSPEVEVEKEAEEVLVPGGIFDKALSRDVPMESEQTLKSEIAVAPALRPEAVNTRGVKRTASPVDLEHELEKDAADPVSRGTKRSLEEETEDMNSVFDAERMSECMSPSTLSGLLTYPVLVENYTLKSIFFGQDAGYEIVDFCGVKAKLWIPKGAIDDSTMGPLPSDHCFAGMKTEIANLSRCEAGIPKRYDEANAFCKLHNTKILTSRWVTNFKIIEMKDGVRARVVVKDFADSKAKATGVSSPTPSTEGLKSVLALASRFHMYLTSLDVSAAFMHTPLRSHCKYVIKLPLSVTWPDNPPMYLELRRALNGLRPASLEWLHYVTSLVEPVGLTTDSREPCILPGPQGLMVIYVDDILCCGFDSKFGKKIHSLLMKEVPTKVTGVIDAKAGGQIRFIGRIIKKLPNDPRLILCVEADYLQETFLEYQIGGTGKSKIVGAAVPNIRGTLETPGESPLLSPESHSKYRRVLGKIAWLAQSREDLHIFVCLLLSTGQQVPREVHEKALRQLLRFLFQDGLVCLSFPSETDLGGDDVLLLSFCDASHAPMRLTNRRGISGAVVVLCNCVIKCFARHQTAVSLSTCESELFAIQAAMQEILGLKLLVSRLVESLEGRVSIFPKGVKLRTDSASARDLLGATDVPRKSRHTEVRIFWVREQLESQKVQIEWIRGTTNPSDMMTKVLDTKTFIHAL